jgi:hypothetical protein
MKSPHSQLRLLLRILGLICLPALLVVVMPVQWLDAAHRAMKLGPFPGAPIAEYLARSVSFLSAFYGGLLLVLARDVERYRSVILYQAVAIMAGSALGIYAGVRAGLPAVWVVGDAVGCWLFLAPIWVLARRVGREGF